MLILASKSPRRKELLEQLGINFSCQSADIDETVKTLETAENYVERLAIEKACALASDVENAYVLGSDTSVVINGEILGKPENLNACINMLSKLSGKRHQVYTGIAIVFYKDQQRQIISEVVITQVDFKTLTEQEIIAYWQTGEPQDKAGSYGIQGIAGQFVQAINGSYSAVVGLPLYETAKLLQQCGFNTLAQSGT